MEPTETQKLLDRKEELQEREFQLTWGWLFDKVETDEARRELDAISAEIDDIDATLDDIVATVG